MAWLVWDALRDSKFSGHVTLEHLVPANRALGNPASSFYALGFGSQLEPAATLRKAVLKLRSSSSSLFEEIAGQPRLLEYPTIPPHFEARCQYITNR